MAEAAGLALTVFSAMNSVIQCFDYVELARTFDRDRQSAILKLDIAKLRLSRWAKSVGFNHVDEQNPDLTAISASPKELQKAQQLLVHIQGLFGEAESKSARLNLGNNESPTASEPNQDLISCGTVST